MGRNYSNREESFIKSGRFTEKKNHKCIRVIRAKILQTGKKIYETQKSSPFSLQ